MGVAASKVESVFVAEPVKGGGATSFVARSGSVPAASAAIGLVRRFQHPNIAKPYDATVAARSAQFSCTGGLLPLPRALSPASSVPAGGPAAPVSAAQGVGAMTADEILVGVAAVAEAVALCAGRGLSFSALPAAFIAVADCDDTAHSQRWVLFDLSSAAPRADDDATSRALATLIAGDLFCALSPTLQRGLLRLLCFGDDQRAGDESHGGDGSTSPLPLDHGALLDAVQQWWNEPCRDAKEGDSKESDPNSKEGEDAAAASGVDDGSGGGAATGEILALPLSPLSDGNDAAEPSSVSLASADAGPSSAAVPSEAPTLETGDARLRELAPELSPEARRFFCVLRSALRTPVATAPPAVAVAVAAAPAASGKPPVGSKSAAPTTAAATAVPPIVVNRRLSALVAALAAIPAPLTVALREAATLHAHTDDDGGSDGGRTAAYGAIARSITALRFGSARGSSLLRRRVFGWLLRPCHLAQPAAAAAFRTLLALPRPPPPPPSSPAASRVSGVNVPDVSDAAEAAEAAAERLACARFLALAFRSRDAAVRRAALQAVPALAASGALAGVLAPPLAAGAADPTSRGGSGGASGRGASAFAATATTGGGALCFVSVIDHAAFVVFDFAATWLTPSDDGASSVPTGADSTNKIAGAWRLDTFDELSAQTSQLCALLRALRVALPAALAASPAAEAVAAGVLLPELLCLHDALIAAAPPQPDSSPDGTAGADAEAAAATAAALLAATAVHAVLGNALAATTGVLVAMCAARRSAFASFDTDGAAACAIDGTNGAAAGSDAAWASPDEGWLAGEKRRAVLRVAAARAFYAPHAAVGSRELCLRSVHALLFPEKRDGAPPPPAVPVVDRRGGGGGAAPGSGGGSPRGGGPPVRRKTPNAAAIVRNEDDTTYNVEDANGTADDGRPPPLPPLALSDVAYFCSALGPLLADCSDRLRPAASDLFSSLLGSLAAHRLWTPPGDAPLSESRPEGAGATSAPLSPSAAKGQQHATPQHFPPPAAPPAVAAAFADALAQAGSGEGPLAALSPHAVQFCTRHAAPLLARCRTVDAVAQVFAPAVLWGLADLRSGTIDSLILPQRAN